MARSRRIVVKDGIYHVMSRTVNGEFFFADEAKETMRRMVHAVAEFSGVEVLTYCLMSNHFHLLVRVPDGAGVVLSDEELVRRYRVLVGASVGKRKTKRALVYAPYTPEQVERRLAKGGADAEVMREQLRSRMYDLSEFMKTLKQRMSIWYNSTRDRYGPVWCDRFKSVLVEGRKEVLLVMAAYIDLNPVRAGLVEDPGKYRYCGYAEALGGSVCLREGLRRVTGVTAEVGDWRVVLSEYRKLLLTSGSGPKAGKGRLDVDEVREILETGEGDLTAGELLGYRLRYMVSGAVLGSEAWVCEQLEGVKEALGRKLAVKPKVLRGLGVTSGKGLRREVS